MRILAGSKSGMHGKLRELPYTSLITYDQALKKPRATCLVHRPQH
jgi:hypothetical protein